MRKEYKPFIEVTGTNLTTGEQEVIPFQHDFTLLDLQSALDRDGIELDELTTLCNYFNPRIIQLYELEIPNCIEVMDTPFNKLLEGYHLYTLLEKHC